jgi:gas vesicle protein
MKSGKSFLAGLLAGAAIGGILALLFAPQSGRETREQLRQKMAELEKDIDSLKETASGKAGNIKKTIAERLAELKREIDELTGSAG